MSDGTAAGCDSGEPSPARASGIEPERRLRDMERLLSVARAMAAEHDIDRLLALIAEASSTVCAAERTSLYAVDHERGELWTKVAQGDGMGVIRLPIGAGIAGTVAKENRPIHIRDAYADPRFNPEVDRRTGFKTRNILCMPLKDRDERRAVGVLQVLNKVGGEGFTAYELEMLATLCAQAGVVLEQAGLRESLIEKRRMEAELGLARQIQERLLPRVPPSVAGLDVAGFCRPSDETGGDYFDYIALPDGRLGVVIGDVSGHGIGSALIMTAARALIRALSGQIDDPARVLSVSNDLLAADLDEGRFLSLCVAVFDAGGSAFSYTSAGHEPPVVLRPRTGEVSNLESTGALLGIQAGAVFPVAGPFELQPGDVLMFTTDGIFEAMDPQEETFGQERLLDTVRSLHERSAQGIVDGLTAAIAAFCRGARQRDDVTAVVVKVTGDGLPKEDAT